MRIGGIIAAVIVLATAASFQGRASGAEREAARDDASAAGPFTNLRVCGTDRIPFNGTACGRDLRATGLVFREIDCSVRVAVRQRTKFSASISYEGQLQYVGHEILNRGRHNELVGVRINPSKMPGGSYSCAFRAGSKRTTVHFESKGPQEKFLGARVCVTPARRQSCRADAAGSPISAPRSLMCGGVFVGFAGKSWGVKIVRRTSTTPVVVGQYGAKHLPGPIAEEWVGFKSRTKVGIYRPAKYSCLFFAGRRQIAEHTFTVGK